MVSLLHLLATIPLILSSLQFVSPSATYLLSKCDNQFNYTQNSVFEKNLNHLLTNLSSETPLTNFYYFTFGGTKEDKVYALLFCPAYIAAQDCQTCVQAAAQSITQTCPSQKGAIIYYMECVLRYENFSFFSTENGNPDVYWNSTVDFYNSFKLNQVLTNTMDGLISKAAFGGYSTPKFATGEGNITGSQQLYCFVECTPDIKGSACRSCLETAFYWLLHDNYGKEWALMYGPNCQMRYGLQAFYEVAPSPSLPPSGSTTNTTINTTASSGKKRYTSVTFITTITLAAILAILVIFNVKYFIMRKVKRLQTSGEATENADSTTSGESLQFDFGTIRVATNNFSDANKLGEGGFGPVYKGVLLNGQEIAVKKLSGNSRQGEEEFKNEVVLLARLRHRNLVNLLGFCLEGNEVLLIYEFMPNKSLDHFIFDDVKRQHLHWKNRTKIIQGFARGLLYLHEDSQLRIIHRDLKAGNILLDAEMNPKIADFGTARLMVLDQSHYIASKIMGTRGYMAPEYLQSGYFSVKSDVFSFGVILLEILSGQKISCFRDEENGGCLLSYAWKNWRKNTALGIVDSALTTGPKSEIMRCIQIGLLCVQENAADRPTMASIVNMLTSSSFTLSLPSHPAFSVPERLDQGNTLHELNSTGGSDQPEIKSEECSVNEATITELVGR